MNAVPITLRKANDFVQEHHRHSGRTSRDGGKWAIGAMHHGKLVGVAIVGRPLARLLDDGWTLEITRTCVIADAPTGTNSFLYQRCKRIWQLMGGQKVITYTLTTESGTSLNALGWQKIGPLKGHQNGWFRRDSPHCRREHQALFEQEKFRWEMELSEGEE
jgi:hypothetical protein